MSLSGFNHLPIEFISSDNAIPLSVLILGICIQVSLYIVFDWDSKIYSFFLGSDRSSIQKQQTCPSKKSFEVQHETKKKTSQDTRSLLLPEQRKNDESMSRGDVEVVYRSLGMLSHPPQEIKQTGRFEERLDGKDVFDLFEEEPPTEEEVRAAFEVFDENKDGFIDGRELQRVLCGLGLREGLEMENCRRMIMAVDENGDNKIDFQEFVKFMDNIFC